MSTRVVQIAFENFTSEVAQAEHIIALRQPVVVNLCGRNRRAGKSEFLRHVLGRCEEGGIRTIRVAAAGPDATAVQLVNDLRRQLGILEEAVDVPPALIDVTLINTKLEGSTLIASPSADVEARREVKNGLDQVVHRLGQNGEWFVVAVDGFDKASSSTRSFIEADLLRALCSCPRGVVFIETDTERDFTDASGRAQHCIELGPVDFELLKELCERNGIEIDDVALRAVYHSTDGTIGGIRVALSNLCRNHTGGAG